MAIKNVLGVQDPKGIGGLTNFTYKSVFQIPIIDPPPTPPDPRDFVCVGDTGFVGDGTYYVLSAYCRGFGGYAAKHTEVPDSLEAEYGNTEETPVILASTPISSDANVGTTPVILEGIQEFAVI